MVTRSVLLGAKLSFFQQKWNAHNTYNWLIQSNISVLSLVPTQLYDLIQLNTPAPPKIKSVVIGGAFLDPALQRKAIELGYPVYASWGMTEAGSQIATAKTIGALPSLLPNWEVAQTQPATISGSALAKGYLTLNETGDVSSRLFNNYFTTSDHIELSSTGEILSVRRADSLIKVLGELISIDEITKSIQKNLPDNHSENWIIIARKHPRRGHHLWLIIEGEVSLTGEFWSALIGAWNQQIGGLKTIEGIKFTSSFPRSPLGKIQKNTLTDRLFS